MLIEGKKTWASSRSLSELCPWLTLADDDVVLCKDGSVFAVFEMYGVDLEGRSGDEIDHAAQNIERAIRGVDERGWILWTSQRRKIFLDEHVEDNANSFQVEYAKWINEKEFFQTRDFMAIGLRPPTGTSRLLSHFIAAAGGHARWRDAFRTLFSSQARLNITTEFLRSQVEFLNETVRQMEGNLSMVDLRRLESEELLGHLHNMLSPAENTFSENIQKKDVPLDAYLGCNEVNIDADRLLFRGATRSVNAAVLTLKEWPSHNGYSYTDPEILTPLLSLPIEYTLVRIFKPLSPDESKEHVNKIRRLHLMKATSLFNHLRMAMSSGTVIDHQDPAHLADADEAASALNEINQGQTGWLTSILVIYGENEQALEKSTEIATRQLVHSGVISYREGMHSLSSWAATLPGNIDESVRYAWTTGANAADLAPVVTLDCGAEINEHLTEQSGIERGALATFQTSHGSPYWFNLHHRDLGHSLVIGPSGSGKSVMVNFLLTRWQEYAPCQTYIFDKDKSCYITTLSNGGEYMNPADGSMRMNPMAGLKTDQDWAWFVSWLEVLLTHRESQITPADDKAIHDAVESVRKLNDATRRLKSLAMILPGRLADRLAPWVEGGQFAQWFDNGEDSFSLGSFVTMAMDELFRQPSVARAFLEYAFFRIEGRMKGDPTLIYLEEAWFALSDPLFAKRIDNWLRTMRKKNGLLVLASQNLDELSRSEAFAAIADNMPTRLFLANPNVDSHSGLYMERFGLRSAQLDIIRNAIPKRDYLVAKPDHSRLIHAQFPKRILARLRSDQKALNVFQSWKDLPDKTDYIQEYENEISN